MYRIWLVLVTSEQKRKKHIRENQSQKTENKLYKLCVFMIWNYQYLSDVSIQKLGQSGPGIHLRLNTSTFSSAHFDSFDKINIINALVAPKTIYIYSCLKLGLNICSFSPMQKFNGTSLLLTTILLPPKPIELCRLRDLSLGDRWCAWSFTVGAGAERSGSNSTVFHPNCESY